MKVVFYDRKNKREVSNEELVFINLVEPVVLCNHTAEDEREIKEFNELFVESKIIGSIGYKSKDCPSYANWNIWLKETDLVFLRLEELC